MTTWQKTKGRKEGLPIHPFTHISHHRLIQPIMHPFLNCFANEPSKIPSTLAFLLPHWLRCLKPLFPASWCTAFPTGQDLTSFSILTILSSLMLPNTVSLLLALPSWSLTHNLLQTSTVCSAVPRDRLIGAPSTYKTQTWSLTHSYWCKINHQQRLLDVLSPI